MSYSHQIRIVCASDTSAVHRLTTFAFGSTYFSRSQRSKCKKIQF